jgi:hypothetical protein
MLLANGNRRRHLRKVEIKVNLITLLLESLGKVKIILKSIYAIRWVDPYPQPDRVHTTTENIFRWSCLIVS